MEEEKRSGQRAGAVVRNKPQSERGRVMDRIGGVSDGEKDRE